MMKNKVTIDNFRFVPGKELIRESAYWQNSVFGRPCYDLNYSSLLTKLIQEAGKHCKYYASDLFILWTSFMDKMKRGGKYFEGGKWLFGFRKSGVDPASNVCDVYNPCGYITSNPESYYESLYMMDVKVNEGRSMEITLGESEFTGIKYGIGYTIDEIKKIMQEKCYSDMDRNELQAIAEYEFECYEPEIKSLTISHGIDAAGAFIDSLYKDYKISEETERWLSKHAWDYMQNIIKIKNPK